MRMSSQEGTSENSVKANFAFWGFCEVRIHGVLRSSHKGDSKKFMWLLWLGVVVFVASSLPVAVGCLAHRFLVFQAGPQGSRDRCQGGRKPGERQVLPEAHRVLEDALEVVARHEHPR